MKNAIRRLWTETRGQDLIEYVLLVAVISLGSIAGMRAVAVAINTVFLNVVTQLTNH